MAKELIQIVCSLYCFGRELGLYSIVQNQEILKQEDVLTTEDKRINLAIK